MVKIENWCVGCRSMGLPCLGDGCPNRHVEVHYCDGCGRELTEERMWNYGREEYCDDCMEDEQDEEV